MLGPDNHENAYSRSVLTQTGAGEVLINSVWTCRTMVIASAFRVNDLKKSINSRAFQVVDGSSYIKC